MKNSNMKWVLMGHRGVGKTSLLSRLSRYKFNAHLNAHLNVESKLMYLDLDSEIEKRTQCSISDIFLKHGERKFRFLEIEIFLQLFEENSHFVMALGAGFDVSALPSEVQKIWIRRETDALGRIFLNRPRLNEQKKASDEYLERFSGRQEKFKKQADQTYWIPEGLQEVSEIEESIFEIQLFGARIQQKLDCGGIRTLTQNDFDSQDFIKSHVLNLAPGYFELRTDLLSENLVASAVKILAADFGSVTHSKILLSFRAPTISEYLVSLTKEDILWDWADELGDCKFGMPKIRSLHEYEGSLESALFSLEQKSAPEIHLKVAAEIKTWKDLETLYHWQQKDPAHRSVLPRSSDGKWKWFRLRMKGWQKLNFWKESDDSAPDQPSLYEWLATSHRPILFAAVLGNPVSHSWSPSEHRTFFAAKQLPFFAIEIKFEDWKQALSILERMGLQAAAVTSPLKSVAFQSCPQTTDRAKELGAINTLVRNQGRWFGHNTDWEGFQYILETHEISKCSSVVVWGGGGTLQMIKSLLPNSQVFPSRSVQLPLGHFEVLVWAANPLSDLPPLSWSPSCIVDLNYREDSRAREYAQLVSAKYISGEGLFKRQASVQQEFWKNF